MGAGEASKPLTPVSKGLQNSSATAATLRPSQKSSALSCCYFHRQTNWI